MTASDGTVVETVTYDPYGEATVAVAGRQSSAHPHISFAAARGGGYTVIEPRTAGE